MLQQPHQFRSFSSHLFVPRSLSSHIGGKAFSVITPKLWNELPPLLVSLKIHLYTVAWLPKYRQQSVQEIRSTREEGDGIPSQLSYFQMPHPMAHKLTPSETTSLKFRLSFIDLIPRRMSDKKLHSTTKLKNELDE